MNTIEYFDISLNAKDMISIVGGGGKTTTMFKLANEFRALNKSVLVTTTTAIYKPNPSQYDNLIILDRNKIRRRYPKRTITVLGREISRENKLLGIDKEHIEDIYRTEIFDYIIVEADGSKGKPIKAPASHEPVIPTCTTKTIGVIGMDCLGKRIDNEFVHRPEIFAQVTNTLIGDNISEEIISKLILSEYGIFKGVPYNSEKYILLNKVDYEKLRQATIKIKDLVAKSENEINGIIAGSMNNGNVIRLYNSKKV